MQNKSRRILVVGNTLLVKEFRALGHEAVSIGTWSNSDIRIGPEEFQLPNLLAKAKPLIEPDVILQVETLGAYRFIIEGLERRTIPAFFYALDCHLNMVWQLPYAQLFDGVFATQIASVEQFQRHGCNAEFLPWGYDPEIFYDRKLPRVYDISFIGTLDPINRIKRGQIIERIQKRFTISLFGTSPANRLTLAEMAEVFSQSKIVINESILRDVNQRYFEAMSCGAMLLTEDIGTNIAGLFKAGTELDNYNPTNLEEKLRFYLDNDAKREVLSAAGQKACAECHTWQRRAQRVLERIAGISPTIPLTATDEARCETDLGKTWYFTARGALVDPTEGYPKAKDYLLRAVEIDNRNFDAHLYGAMACADFGIRDEALRLFNAAYELEPNNALMHFYFGLFCASLNRPNEAKLCFFAATNPQPDFVKNYGKRWAAVCEQWPLPAEFFLLAGKLFEYLDLGTGYGDYERGASIFPLFAVDCYRRSAILNPNSTEVSQWFGDVCMKNGVYELALAAFAQVYDRGNRDTSFLIRLEQMRHNAYMSS